MGHINLLIDKVAIDTCPSHVLFYTRIVAIFYYSTSQNEAQSILAHFKCSGSRTSSIQYKKDLPWWAEEVKYLQWKHKIMRYKYRHQNTWVAEKPPFSSACTKQELLVCSQDMGSRPKHEIGLLRNVTVSLLEIFRKVVDVGPGSIVSNSSWCRC